MLEARRQQRGSAGLEGLEEGITRIWSAVTGQTSRYIRVNADFSVAGFSAHQQDASIREVGLLSGGTLEQLWMSVRVALGEMYAEKYGRQAMILDDVLVYTDPDRHDRMLQVLRRCSEKLQIFILTSRPSLYRGLTESEYQFDVGALRA